MRIGRDWSILKTNIPGTDAQEPEVSDYDHAVFENL